MKLHDRHPGGAVVLVQRHRLTDHFTILPNAALRDRRLSARARGVLGFLLSLPDGWTTSADRLAVEFTEGRDAIRTAVREIEAIGYLTRDRTRDAQGRWVDTWTVTTAPDTPTESEIPDADSQALDLTSTNAASPQVRPDAGNQAHVFQAHKVLEVPTKKTEEEGPTLTSSSDEARGAVVEPESSEPEEHRPSGTPEPETSPPLVAASRPTAAEQEQERGEEEMSAPLAAVSSLTAEGFPTCDRCGRVVLIPNSATCGQCLAGPTLERYRANSWPETEAQEADRRWHPQREDEAWDVPAELGRKWDDETEMFT